MARLRLGTGNAAEKRARDAEEQRQRADELARMIERGECPAGALDRQLIARCIREAAQLLDATKRGRGAPRRKTPDDDSLALLVALRIAKGENEPEARAAVALAFNINDSTLNRRIKPCLDDAKRLFAGAHLLGRSR